MKIDELIDRLEDLRERYGNNKDVHVLNVARSLDSNLPFDGFLEGSILTVFNPPDK